MPPLNLGYVLHLTTVKITLCKSLQKGSSQYNQHIHAINLVLLMKDKGCPAGCVLNCARHHTPPCRITKRCDTQHWACVNIGNGMLYNCERCSQCPLNEGNASCWCQKKIRGNRTGSVNSSRDKTVSFLPRKPVACRTCVVEIRKRLHGIWRESLPPHPHISKQLRLILRTGCVSPFKPESLDSASHARKNTQVSREEKPVELESKQASNSAQFSPKRLVSKRRSDLLGDGVY